LSDYGPNGAAWRRAHQAKEEARQLRYQAKIFRGKGYEAIARTGEGAAARKETEAALQVWPAWGRWVLPEEAEVREATGCDF